MFLGLLISTEQLTSHNPCRRRSKVSQHRNASLTLSQFNISLRQIEMGSDGWQESLTIEQHKHQSPEKVSEITQKLGFDWRNILSDSRIWMIFHRSN